MKQNAERLRGERHNGIIYSRATLFYIGWVWSIFNVKSEAKESMTAIIIIFATCILSFVLGMWFLI